MQMGHPWWLSAKDSTCQCRQHALGSWSRKILPAMKQQPPERHNCCLSSRAWEMQLLSQHAAAPEAHTR